MEEKAIYKVENTPQIVVQKERELTPAIWSMISSMAPVMHQSRLFGVTSQEQAAAIMLKGYELGMSITASFELIQVIQGRPGLSPRGALAMLHSNPEITKIEVKKLVDKDKFLGYECTMARRNGFTYTAQYTMEDAQKAEVIKKDSGWVHYPENMCLWRAIGFAADVVAPDITAGMTSIMKMPEALGVEINNDGQAVEVQAVEVTSQYKGKPVPTTTLDDLINQYGAESVMIACGQALDGRMPASDTEMEMLKIALDGQK
jgi:hypothetical protein